ncbi:DNA circularization N-terminal domain-containing protein [Mesorhizobium sp. L-2-11]|uniref:DNA circularization N-terminal domain-containing protein n=1 Tax=Mesorhizobium sp. L-2-11 TaxID=2744521 RepID=UPI0018EC18F5|nr:DNA circularization N-terminal domain-containing protein [Mesorhizobium sp. L-2-11]BCH20178.1 tail protein [Mesorhizobium sp. L-2-11]
MRDWLKAFRPATFRGVPFFVDYEDAEGGRRVAVSPIAYSDLHVTEDMGGDVRRFSLSAYVAGDLADAAARAFTAALNAPGAATLVLPMGGPVLVRVPRWSLSRERGRAGYVGFDIEFIAAGLPTLPFAAVPGALAIASLIAAGIDMIAAATAFRMRDVAPGQAAPSALAVTSAASRMTAVADASELAEDKRPVVADAIATITRLAAEPVAQASAIASAIVSTVGAIADTASPAEAVEAFAVAAVPAGDDVFDLVSAAAFAAGFCQTLAAGDYLSRQDARRARDRISPVIDPVLDALSRGLDVSVNEWLSDIAATAASDLSAVAANRAPLVTVHTEVSLPATALAYALYGDAGRAGELARRNSVATPAAMPISFEAIAP